MPGLSDSGSNAHLDECGSNRVLGRGSDGPKFSLLGLGADNAIELLSAVVRRCFYLPSRHANVEK